MQNRKRFISLLLAMVLIFTMGATAFAADYDEYTIFYTSPDGFGDYEETVSPDGDYLHLSSYKSLARKKDGLPEMPGTFVGWRNDRTGEMIKDNKIRLDEIPYDNLFVTAVFEAGRGEVTVRYLSGLDDGWDHSNELPPTSIMEDETTIKLPKCEIDAPAGYKFTGWESGGKIYEVGEKFTVKKDTTFTATWNSGKVKITFSPGEGSGNAYSIEVEKNGKLKDRKSVV